MELAFELVEGPRLSNVAPFRFAHHRLRGPYQPWARVQALDAVAETLERAEVSRTGPAFGIYYDLPASSRDVDAWTADLGYPVGDDAAPPNRPGLRVRNVPEIRVVSLRYRGDLTSFPDALGTLVEWALDEGHDVRGPLLERFHVSDALSGEEERDVYVALDPLLL